MRNGKANRLPCGRPCPPEALSGPRSGAGLVQEKLAALDLHIKRQGFNRSEAREKIVRLIAGRLRHFTVNELITEVSRVHREIGAATVYRNLPILIEAGIVRESLMTREGQKIYELEDEDHHDHIVCVDCDRIFEFHEEVIEDAQEKVSARLDFAPLSHRHVIYARCQYRK